MATSAAEHALNFRIQARDREFQRVAERVTKRLERLEKGGARTTRQFRLMSDVLRRFPGFQAALGAGAAALSVRALNRQLTESISRLDRLGKRARNIGIQVEVLQLWGQAAREAGVETDAFQRGLLRFNRVLGEAGTGAGEYEEIFERLGVRIRDANGELRPMQAVLGDVTQAFGRLDQATQQLTIEELFGRGGREMRAFLLDFNSQVAGVEKGFRGASAEAAQLAEELQNMRDRGIGNLTAALDEALVRLDRFFGLTRSITDFWNRAAEAIRFAVAHGPFSAAPRTAVSVYGASAAASGPGPGRHPPAVAGRARAPVASGRGFGFVHAQTAGRRAALGLDVEAPAGRADGTSPADLRRRQTSERFARILERQQQQRQDKIRQTQQLENKLAEARRDAYLTEQERLEELQKMRERAAARQEAMERAQYERAYARLSDVVGNFIRGAGDIGGALSGLLTSLSSAIIDQFAGQIAGRLLSGAAGGFLGGLFGFQRGGPVQRGRAVLVGEGGPEVFVPRTSGHIVPNQGLRGGGGNVTIAPQFFIESTDGPGVRAALREAMPAFTRTALQAVATQQSRPGSVLGRQNRRGG